MSRPLRSSERRLALLLGDAAAVAANPGIPQQIARGEFAPLHDWLRTSIYQHGAKFKPAELVERVTGTPMRIGPYVAYLRAKYGALYRLPAA